MRRRPSLRERRRWSVHLPRPLPRREWPIRPDRGRLRRRRRHGHSHGQPRLLERLHRQRFGAQERGRRQPGQPAGLRGRGLPRRHNARTHERGPQARPGRGQHGLRQRLGAAEHHPVIQRVPSSTRWGVPLGLPPSIHPNLLVGWISLAVSPRLLLRGSAV